MKPGECSRRITVSSRDAGARAAGECRGFVVAEHCGIAFQRVRSLNQKRIWSLDAIVRYSHFVVRVTHSAFSRVKNRLENPG